MNKRPQTGTYSQTGTFTLAVVRNYLILIRFANFFEKLLKKSLTWSVSTCFGDPNMQIHIFK